MLSQALALDELHDEEMAAVGFFRVVRLDDAGMGELCQRLGLPLETGDGAGIVDAALGQHLDGDAAIKALVVGQIDLAHAALAELF